MNGKKMEIETDSEMWNQAGVCYVANCPANRLKRCMKKSGNCWLKLVQSKPVPQPQVKE
jgi:hypothetical protein